MEVTPSSDVQSPPTKSPGAKMKDILGFGKARAKDSNSPFSAMNFQNERFATLKQKANRLKPWSEMKFESQTPECRSNHATCTYDGTLLLYGGRDAGRIQGLSKELWML